MSKGEIDRLAPRARPAGNPVLHQRWNNLLFLHWPMDPAELRPLIPEPLQLDLFDNQAWLTISPFHLDDVRPPRLPAFPGLSSFHELNVRTYVVYNGMPGVWFFSLDCSKLLPTLGARLFFMLPYYKASIRYLQGEETFAFTLKRTTPANVEFRASWQVGNPLRDPHQESLAFFLVERYCLFAVDEASLYQVRIYHHPWILEEASVTIRCCSMLHPLNLRQPQEKPLVHFSRSMVVDTWAPAKVGSLVKTAVRIPVE